MLTAAQEIQWLYWNRHVSSCCYSSIGPYLKTIQSIVHAGLLHNTTCRHCFPFFNMSCSIRFLTKFLLRSLCFPSDYTLSLTLHTAIISIKGVNKFVFVMKTQFVFCAAKTNFCRSPWPRGLNYGSAAARLLSLRVRIPPSYECLSRVSVVCSEVEVSASGWSLIQRSPTKCGVSECDREASTMTRPWPTRVCCAIKNRNWFLNYYKGVAARTVKP
jgi:hypothetical protein